MSEPSSEPTPAERVAADPFWSVVRRRHPDVDLVVLPADDTPAATLDPGGPTTPESPIDLDTEAARLDEQAKDLWRSLVPDAPGEPSARSRWTSGATPGGVRRETTVALDGADPVGATAVIGRATERLTAAGWHALAPEEGMPRVMAARESSAGRTELQLVLVPAAGRLVLRVRSIELRVGAPAAREAVAAPSSPGGAS